MYAVFCVYVCAHMRAQAGEDAGCPDLSFPPHSLETGFPRAWSKAGGQQAPAILPPSPGAGVTGGLMHGPASYVTRGDLNSCPRAYTESTLSH